MVGLHIVAQAKAYAQAEVLFQMLQDRLLTGKYRRRERPADSRQVGKSEWAMALTEALFDRLEQLEAKTGPGKERYCSTCCWHCWSSRRLCF